jgi:predicted DNA-binding protein
MVPGMAMKKRPTPFPLRLHQALRKRLEALAKADRRTLTNYILMVLERHADDAEKSSGADEGRKR